MNTGLGAVIFSLIEIEIEGENGWALNTKTAPISATSLYYSYYHLFMFLYVVISVKAGTKTITQWVFHIIAWLSIEDTCWFILNPAGWKMLTENPQDIWWMSSIILIPSWWGYVCCFILFATREIPVNDAIILLLTAPIVLLLQNPYQAWYKWVHNLRNATNTTEIPNFSEYNVVKQAQEIKESNNHTQQLIVIGIVLLFVIVKNRTKCKIKTKLNKTKHYTKANYTELEVQNISF